MARASTCRPSAAAAARSSCTATSSRSHDDLYTDPQLPLAFSATLGGLNGDDNHGGDLESSHDGSIFTDGTGTTGIRLQSIGGGGGLLFVDVTSEDPSRIRRRLFRPRRDQFEQFGRRRHQSITRPGSSAPRAISRPARSSSRSAAAAARPRLSSAPRPATGAERDRAIAVLDGGCRCCPDPAVATTVTLGSVGGTGNDGGSIDLSLLRRLPDRGRSQPGAWSNNRSAPAAASNWSAATMPRKSRLAEAPAPRAMAATSRSSTTARFPDPRRRLARARPADDRRRRRRGVRRLHQPRADAQHRQ